MKRLALVSTLALLCSVVLVSTFTATVNASEQAATKAAPTAPPPQATGAAPTTPAPAAKAKFYRPVKGTAYIQVIQTPSKPVGKDMVTVLKIKNMSNGRIDLLQIDEYWYDTKSKEVSGSTEKWRKTFNPGDIIEVTMRSPIKPNLYKSQYMFTHANGKIDAKAVKKFD